MRVVALNRPDDTAWPASMPTWRLDAVSILCVGLVLLCGSNLARLPVAQSGALKAPIILNDLFAGLVIVAGALTAMSRRSFAVDDVSLGAFAFAMVGGLSAVAAGPRFDLTFLEVAMSLAYLARWVLYLGVYVVVINYVRARDVGRVWTALETGAVLFAAFGIVQSIFLPNFAFKLFPDSRAYIDHDPQGHRLVSTILDPNLAAAFILTVLLVHFGILAAGGRVRAWKTVILTVALMLTLSRSGVLALIVGMGVIVAANGLGRRFMKFAAAAGAILLAISPWLLQLAIKYERLTIGDGSAASRLVGWGRAISLFVENPWFGIGFNTYGFVLERKGYATLGVASYSVEGGLLFIAVMTGVVGLAFYCVMLLRVVTRCRRAWRSPVATAEERGFVAGVAALTVAMVVNSLFVNSLLTPSVMWPMLVLWGLSFVIAADVRRRSLAVLRG